MLNIPTTEMVSVQFNVLVLWMLLTLGAGLIIGYRIKEFLLKYRIVNIQPDQLRGKNENISTKF
jgi:hypothetical protein